MNIVTELSKQFVHRATTLGLKGKKRDDEVMAFFSGAAVALFLAGKLDESRHVNTLTGMVLAVRGYAEVERIAKTETTP